MNKSNEDIRFVYSQIVQPTAANLSLRCRFFTSSEENLVVATQSVITVYQTVEYVDNGKSYYALKARAQYSLNGEIISMIAVPLSSLKDPSQNDDHDALVVSFKYNMITILKYDSNTGSIASLRSYNFNKNAEGLGAMSEITDRKSDNQETRSMSSENMNVYDRPLKVGVLRYYESPFCILTQINHFEFAVITDLRENPFILTLLKDESYNGSVIDYQFLNDYIEPTLVVVEEKQPSWMGNELVRQNTCCCRFLFVNLYNHMFSQVHKCENIPNTITQIVPLKGYHGGCLLLSTHSLYYISLETKFYTSLLSNKEKFYNQMQNASYTQVQHSFETSILFSNSIVVPFCEYQHLLVITGYGKFYKLSLIMGDQFLSDIRVEPIPFTTTILSTVASYHFHNHLFLFFGSKCNASLLSLYDPTSSDPSTMLIPYDTLPVLSPITSLTSSSTGQTIYSSCGMNQQSSFLTLQNSIPLQNQIKSTNLNESVVFTVQNYFTNLTQYILLSDRTNTVCFDSEFSPLSSEQCPFELHSKTIAVHSLLENEVVVQVSTHGLRFVYNGTCIQAYYYYKPSNENGFGIKSSLTQLIKSTASQSTVCLLFDNNTLYLLSIKEKDLSVTLVSHSLQSASGRLEKEEDDEEMNKTHEFIATSICLYTTGENESTQLFTKTTSKSSGKRVKHVEKKFKRLKSFVLEKDDDLNQPLEEEVQVEPIAPVKSIPPTHYTSTTYLFVAFKNNFIRIFSLAPFEPLFTCSSILDVLLFQSRKGSSFSTLPLWKYKQNNETVMNDHVYIDDIVVDTIGIENVPSLQDVILSIHTNNNSTYLYKAIPSSYPKFKRVYLSLFSSLHPKGTHRHAMIPLSSVDSTKLFYIPQYNALLLSNKGILSVQMLNSSISSVSSYYSSTKEWNLIYLTKSMTELVSFELHLGSLHIPYTVLSPLSPLMLTVQPQLLSTISQQLSKETILNTIHLPSNDPEEQLVAFTSTETFIPNYLDKTSKYEQIFHLALYDMHSAILHTQIAFESTEKVTALASLHLRNMLTNEYVDVIAVGLAKTNKNGDTGRLLIYSYENHAFTQLLEDRFQEFSYPIANIAEVKDNIILTLNNKMMICTLELQNTIVFNPNIWKLTLGHYITSIQCFPDYIFATDITNGFYCIRIVSTELKHDSESILSNVYLHCNYCDLDRRVRLVCTDNRGNVDLYFYNQKNKNISISSQFHLPSPITSLLHVNVPASEQKALRGGCLVSTKEGEIGLLYPITETYYNILSEIQKTMVNYLPQEANLNLEIFREPDLLRPNYYKSYPVLDLNYLIKFALLPMNVQHDLTETNNIKREDIFLKLEKIYDDINRLL